MKKLLKLPKFKNEDKERDFWAKIDLSEYYEPSDMEPVSFPNLKPTTRSISIRLPEYLINRIKEQANELSISYQSLINYRGLKPSVFPKDREKFVSRSIHPWIEIHGILELKIKGYLKKAVFG